MDLTNDDLLRLAADAAAAADDASPPPAPASSFVDAIVASDPPAERGLPATWPGRDGAGISPLDAFIDTAAEFGALLDSLEPGDWERRTRVQQASVRELVEHLVGMERYTLGQLGHGAVFTADRREDHWPVTRAAAADAAGLTDDDVVRQWWDEVLRVVAACSELDPQHGVRYHHLAGNVRGLLVSRTFELWAHGDDIRQAVGLPLNLLDEARLALMVHELMGAFSAGMALTGQDLPGRTARFELDGAGGGTFDVALSFGERPAVPDLVVSTTTIDLCRLAANRLHPDDLGAGVSGDASLLQPVLVAAGAFAAD